MSETQSNVAPNTQENVESTGILGSIQNLASNVIETVKEGVLSVEETAINVKDQVASTIISAEETALHMKDQVASTLYAAEEKVLQAVHLAGEKATETKDTTMANVQSTTNMASEKLGQAKQATTEKMSQASTVASEKLDQAKQVTNEKMNQASAVASEKLGQAKQATSEQMGKLNQMATHAKGTASQQMKDTVETTKNSDMLHTVTGTATAVGNSVMEEIQMLKNMASEKIHQVTDTGVYQTGVYQTGVNLANQAVSTVSSGIETAKSTLSGLTHQATEAKEEVKENVSEVIDKELKVMPTTEASVVDTQPTLVNETGTVPSIVMEALDAGLSTPYQALDLNADTVPTKANIVETQPINPSLNVVDADTVNSFVEPSTEEEWTEVKNYHTIQKEKSMVKDQPIADNVQSQAITQERK